MLKIVSLDIIDVIPANGGISFVLREDLPEGGTKVSFYLFNTDTKQIQHMSKDDYLKSKFGDIYESVAKAIGDYVSCDATKLWNGDTFVIFPNGEFGVFDNKGSFRTGALTYRDMPARDATTDNNYIWSVVPDLNLIVKYSTLQDRVIMRIGGDASTTFSNPVSIEAYENDLYVCNSGSNIIKKISLADYNVTDYKEFDEPVYQYLRVNDREFVVLASGVYML